jgi:hypothetical protein
MESGGSEFIRLVIDDDDDDEELRKIDQRCEKSRRYGTITAENFGRALGCCAVVVSGD